MITGFGIFAIIMILLLSSWALVTFYQSFLENLFYRTLGYDPENTWTSLWLAIVSTSFFFVIVWLIKYLEIVPNIDVLIFDYNEDANFGGNLEAARRPRYRRVTGRISPRGALFVNN